MLIMLEVPPLLMKSGGGGPQAWLFFKSSLGNLKGTSGLGRKSSLSLTDLKFSQVALSLTLSLGLTSSSTPDIDQIFTFCPPGGVNGILLWFSFAFCLKCWEVAEMLPKGE